MIAKRCIVSGRVQGVFYRASAQQEARRLGVQGFAKNLPNGCVEVLAVGGPEQVNEFVQWLWKGSPASHVIDVQVRDVPLADLHSVPTDFRTA